MTLPTRPDPPRPPATDLLVPDLGPPQEGVTLLDAWGILLRRWRWVAAAVLVALAGAVALVSSGEPMYEGVVTLRFADAEGAIPGIPGAASVSEVSTEIEELRSRTLAEAAARSLGLRLQTLEPAGVAGTSLVDSVAVPDDVDAATYVLTRARDTGFVVTDQALGTVAGTAVPGTVATVGRISLRLDSSALAYPRIVLRVVPLARAASRVRGGLSVARATRDANIVNLKYRTPDPELAWRVPNAIAAEFTARRSELQEAGGASTIAFLREQLDTVSRQLAASEEALRRFRESERAISPGVEASSQVQRAVELEADRGAIEAERVALARLLADVEADAQRQAPGEPSAYRRLVAFPTLMRHSASTNVLSSLSALETERNELLTRRTEADPDVKALTARIEQLEDELRTTAVTYLGGLGDQVAGIDATLANFNRELSQLPRREVEYARLERTPKMLDGIYTMLQTRLKEAEISQAAADRTVRIVDAAAPPLGPAPSRRMVMAVGVVMAGLLLGLAVAFVRELTDVALHTRADVQSITGLPVLGLIPRIRGARGRIASLGKRTTLPASANGTPPSLPAAAPDAVPVYTFFGAEPPPRPDPPRTRNGNGSHAPRTGLATVPSQIAAVEAYGILQTNIAFSRLELPPTTLALTSARPGDGKTTTAVNLAITLAMRGSRVLLIDTDLRKGRVHAALECDREPGLSEFLQGLRSWTDTVASVAVEGRRELHYVTCGRPPQSPLGMLESPAFRELLIRLRPEYDTIILDSPPANVVSDAALVASLADGVLLVARAGITDADALAHALTSLRHVGASVLGVVLNDIDFRRESRYDRAYRFYDTSSYLGAAEQYTSS